MASPESARLVGRHADCASDVRAAHGTHPGALRLQVPWRSGGNLKDFTRNDHEMVIYPLKMAMSS